VIEATGARVPGSPVAWSAQLGRRIRDDDIDTLGTSSLTLAERALARGDFDVAADLIAYQHEEMTRINQAVLTWLIEILARRSHLAGASEDSAHVEAASVVAAMTSYDAGEGDLAAALAACGSRRSSEAQERAELMRIRVAAVHDLLVWWTQQLLSDLAERHGEDAVLDVVVTTYETLWAVRYSTWYDMEPLDRLRLSVEGMRGHLSGPRHRGDVGIVEEADVYRMVLDPCGSCGVLRRGDPDSGRSPGSIAGTTEEHDWAYGRLGLGWYAVHSAIVMEWLQVRDGNPPVRPLFGCDQDGPCTWFIYKDPSRAVPAEPSMAALFKRRRPKA